MESNIMPITKQEMTELLREQLGGIHIKLDAHEDLLEALATEMNVVQDVLHQHDKRFDHHDDLFERVTADVNSVQKTLHHHDELLQTMSADVNTVQKTIRQHDNLLETIVISVNAVQKTLHHHDDLLETIATEVNSFSMITEPIVPVQHDHEERIGRLERGYTRLLLKS